MTAPRLHTDDFETRRDAPAMSAIERGHRLRISYTPSGGSPRTAHGRVTYAGYGQFRDVITFEPFHTETTWRLECYKTGLALYYQHAAPDDWRRIDEPHTETVARVMVSDQ